MNTNTFDASNLKEKNYYAFIQDIIEYIRAKHYKPGERLPQEAVLAQELNTNRSTLREILRVLEVLGIIDSQRGSGNIYQGNLEVGFMNLFLISSMLSDGKPYECSSIRAAVEANAVELFIEKAKDADIFRLELIYTEGMNKSIDKLSADYLENHLKFHDQIMKYYPNDTAKQLIRSNLRLMKRDYEKAVERDPSIDPQEKAEIRRKLESNSHAAIIAAIKARDIPKARELVVNHAFMTGVHKRFT